MNTHLFIYIVFFSGTGDMNDWNENDNLSRLSITCESVNSSAFDDESMVLSADPIQLLERNLAEVQSELQKFGK